MRLADLNDYLGPSQACIKPMMIKPKDEQKDPLSLTSSTDATGTAAVTARPSNRGQIVSIQLESGTAARPSLLTSALAAPPAFNQMKVSTKKTATVSLNDCLACSGCVTSAETVLIEQQSLSQLTAQLAAKGESDVVVLSVSPQSMASLAVRVGLDVVECERRLLTLLRSMGVDELVECRQYNDIALLEAGDEFIRHYRASRLASTLPQHDSESMDEQLPLPLLASECPGWVCYAEKTQGGYILPHMSTVKSPQQITGLYLKRHYAATHHHTPQHVYHVTIQPCFDKKLEASRSEHATGFCFGHGLRLLTSDGGSVAVENVRANDWLVGGDGLPVRVQTVQPAPNGAAQLWTMRLKDYMPNVGGLTAHEDVSVTDEHLLELVTWRRTRINRTTHYYWHHFQAAPGAPWVPVPAGDTRVWTGKYDYRLVDGHTAAQCIAECTRLRLNFRGVRWSVSVHDYVAQLRDGWPCYDGSPHHSTECYDEAPHRTATQRRQNPVNPATGYHTRPQAVLSCPDAPNCTEPHDHDVDHSKAWWAQHQPAPSQPTHFDQLGGAIASLHARILRLFGRTARNPADRWAAPDQYGASRWRMVDTLEMAWLIGLWLADGHSDAAVITQTEQHVDGTNDHAEVCEGIRQLSSLIWRLRNNPGVPLAQLPTHAAVWTDLGGKATRAVVAGDIESQLARYHVVGPTGNHKYVWHPDFERANQPDSWFRVLLDSYGIIMRWNDVRSRKRVPGALLSDDVNVRRHLLAGYIDGDGTRAAKASYVASIATTLQPTLGIDTVHLARGLGYAVGNFTFIHRDATDEQPAGEWFQLHVSGVQEYLVQAPPAGQLPRPRAVPVGAIGTLHADTLPVRLTYKRIPPFDPYDGVDSRATETCSDENYSWGFSLRRAAAVDGGATEDIGCPLAPPAFAGPTTNYVAITVQPRPPGHSRAGEQTVLSSDFLVLHNSPAPLESGRDEHWTAELGRDVDLVLSTGELWQLIEERCGGVDEFVALECSELNELFVSSTHPFDQHSSGGYADHVYRHAVTELFHQPLPSFPLPWRQHRSPDYMELTYEHEGRIVLRFARMYGFRHLQSLVRSMKAGQCQYEYVEVMACPSGCVNGGGQLKVESKVPKVQRELVRQVGEAYRAGEVRSVGESGMVRAVYDGWLGCGVGEKKARDMLYTSFKAIDSAEVNPLTMKW